MSLPDCFSGHNDGKLMATGGPKGDNGKVKKSRAPKLAWITKCHNMLSDWKIPDGRNFYDYENFGGLPGVPAPPEKKASMHMLGLVFKWQVQKSAQLCHAHMPIKEMGLEVKKIASDQFKVIHESNQRGPRN